MSLGRYLINTYTHHFPKLKKKKIIEVKLDRCKYLIYLIQTALTIETFNSHTTVTLHWLHLSHLTHLPAWPELSWCIEPRCSDSWMTDGMVPPVLSYKEELQILLLRFASNINHSEHQPASWKMKAHHHSFNLWNSSKFCLRGNVEVKGEVQLHFFFKSVCTLKYVFIRWEGLLLTLVQMQFLFFLHKTHPDTFKVQMKLDNQVSDSICEEQFQQTPQSRVTLQEHGE